MQQRVMEVWGTSDLFVADNLQTSIDSYFRHTTWKCSPLRGTLFYNEQYRFEMFPIHHEEARTVPEATAPAQLSANAEHCCA